MKIKTKTVKKIEFEDLRKGEVFQNASYPCHYFVKTPTQTLQTGETINAYNLSTNDYSNIITTTEVIKVDAVLKIV